MVVKQLAVWLALAVSVATAGEAGAVTWSCPAGYHVHAGLNTDFPLDGAKRAFVVAPPKDAQGPAPVWVPLTGSVESTNDNLYVARSGANARLADHGFMVIGPVRACANQDPALEAGVCNGPGHDGWTWNPWREGRAPDASGKRFETDEGPDSRFLIAMVRCVGTKYPLDPRRLYLGGISSGGTMTNRALTFRSDFWAGGMPISGEWYVTRDDGSALSFDDARRAVADAPDVIHQGRVGPFPLKSALAPMIAIVVWGGDRDIWHCGSVLCADYRPSTQAAANYYASFANVVEISCTLHDGHMWPQLETDDFNLWALTTMASYPKGSDPRGFALTPPPPGYSCARGPFTDHYPPATPPEAAGPRPAS
jgi:poly(3-hydroxybutyrate) depolymerase